jgi:hypothetical protein
MAPKLRGSKRGAKAAGLAEEEPSKKGGAAHRREQCGVVAEAVQAADLPKAVVGMLSNKTLLKDCLAVPKEERHAFQEQVIQMITEVMESLEAALTTKITDAEKKVASSDEDKASKEAAEKAASEALEAKKTAAEEAKTASAEAIEAAKAAKAALTKAKEEQEEGDAELEAAGTKKEKVEAGKGFLEALKAGTLEEGKVSEAVEELVAVAKDFGFDGTMITTLPSALSKAPSDRGAFDEMVFTQADDALVKQIATLADTIANGETGKAARAAKVTEATTALEAAEAASTAKKEAKTEAAAAQKEADTAFKAAAKEVKGHGPLMKQCQKDLESTKSDLVEFCEGPKATFSELVAYTLIVPEAPAAAEAPAEMAVEPAATA